MSVTACKLTLYMVKFIFLLRPRTSLINLQIINGCTPGKILNHTWQSHGRRDESPLNITPGSGKSLPPNCAEKHMVTPGPGFGIRDLPDCAEKHRGSGLGRARRKRMIAFQDSTQNFFGLAMILCLPPKSRHY